MEKLDALLLKDEEGTHYVPISNIESVCEEIGQYNYGKKEYNKRYSRPRYIVRTVGSEWFIITKQIYKKIVEYCYNVVIEGERTTGDYSAPIPPVNPTSQEKSYDLCDVFVDGNKLMTAIDGELSIDDELREMIALFSEGRYFVDITNRFSGKVLNFTATMKRHNIPINNPIYVSTEYIKSLYSYKEEHKE